jgi:hypothetical protein
VSTHRPLRPTLEDENGKYLADLSLLAEPTRVAIGVIRAQRKANVRLHGHPHVQLHSRFRKHARGRGKRCIEKIIGGVTAIVSYRPGGCWMQQSAVPRCAILSVGITGGIG